LLAIRLAATLVPDLHGLLAEYPAQKIPELQAAAMDIHSLPRYRGLADSAKGWAEPDGHGKRPSVRLRDYEVLSLILMIGFPILLCLVDHLWACHRDTARLNMVREREMEMESSRSLF
jgi:hypothetical protein